jgi:glycosyltransferase involved in cell wall biosynthesis
MRVIHLSWEYPPRRVGGIAAALEGLCPALARTGIEVHVVTSRESGGEADENPAPNLFIHRVDVGTPANDFVHGIHLLNEQMEYRVEALLNEFKRRDARKKNKAPTLLHVHDWLALFSGRNLKYRHRIPMLATVHATEYGRNGGRIDPHGVSGYVNHCEGELQYEAWRVIVCSAYMRQEITDAFNTPWDKIDISYNGIESNKFDFEFSDEEKRSFRARFAADYEKIIYFIGRPVHEKGAHLLVQALPIVRNQGISAKLVIAGGGGRGHLEALAGNLGVWNHVYFAGRVSDEDRDRLYKVADCACYPSLYEPFGIVALEAMAAGVPVVTSDAGGLPEVVEHNVTGTQTYAGNVGSLAWGIQHALRDPEHARWMADNAKKRVEFVFNWDRIAAQTKDVYARVQAEYETSAFKP